MLDHVHMIHIFPQKMKVRRVGAWAAWERKMKLDGGAVDQGKRK